MTLVDVIGGGPAGAMAAIAALQRGASVRVYEKAAFPRHKVCGEFLSPDVVTLLRRVGCADAFFDLAPATIGTMELHFGSRVVQHALPAPAYGLSRYALDRLLLDHAVAIGADVVRDTATARTARRPLVLTNGRTAHAPAGDRLFGFKAHFRGASDGVVALHFFDGCYAGVSAVEGGAVNVCGVAPERLLRECDFEPERLLERCRPLRSRLARLERSFDWLTTGPLVTGPVTRSTADEGIYPAGDAMGFIDPFTGSGILNAMLSGYEAGTAAATGLPFDEYARAWRRALRRPFAVSAVFRAVIASGIAGPLAAFVPGKWLFALTRPVIPPEQDVGFAGPR